MKLPEHEKEIWISNEGTDENPSYAINIRTPKDDVDNQRVSMVDEDHLFKNAINRPVKYNINDPVVVQTISKFTTRDMIQLYHKFSGLFFELAAQEAKDRKIRRILSE